MMSPVFHQESVLLTLPFGGAVLRALGMSQPETEAILEDFRKIHMEDVIPVEDTFNFLEGYASTAKTAVISYPVEKREKDDKEKDKERDKERDKHHKESNWEDTEEQERQEEEEEMHEYSRNVRKLNMNGMIGAVEEEPTDADAPVSVYLDGVVVAEHNSTKPSVASVGAQDGGSTQ